MTFLWLEGDVMLASSETVLNEITARIAIAYQLSENTIRIRSLDVFLGGKILLDAKIIIMYSGLIELLRM